MAYKEFAQLFRGSGPMTAYFLTGKWLPIFPRGVKAVFDTWGWEPNSTARKTERSISVWLIKY
jgi:hypothetical protein